MKSPQREEDVPTLSIATRSAISLFLVIHGFMIAVAFFSVAPPTPLQARLLGVLGIYLQTFNFDLDSAPYYLTSNVLEPTAESYQIFGEREYFVEALPKGASPQDDAAWFRVGDAVFDWSESSRRHQRVGALARIGDREEWQAELVLALAREARAESGNDVMRVRVRQHIPIPQELYANGVEVDPQAPVWFRTVYEAIVVNDKILPVVDDRETANATGGATESGPSGPTTPATNSTETPATGPANPTGSSSPPSN